MAQVEQLVKYASLQLSFAEAACISALDHGVDDVIQVRWAFSYVECL